MIGFQAFRYELDPSNRQRTQLARHAGCARFVYNWGLARRIEQHQKTGISPDAEELHRELDRLKSTAFPWMHGISRCVPKESLRDLEAAFRRFLVLRATAKTRWRRRGFPRFKVKNSGRDSFRLTGSISVANRWVRLPFLGSLRTKESVGKLRGRILSGTVAREADRWFVALLVEGEVAQAPARSGSPVGVDVGITDFAVISDEQDPIAGPKAVATSLRKQKRLARAVSRKTLGSKNQQKASLRLARHHRRVANVRRDFLHKLSTRLTRDKAAIVVEDLTIGRMLSNRSLARRVGDAGWGTGIWRSSLP